MSARTIRFTLNGQPVTAEVTPHHNLVELLQTQFDLFGARESCGQGLCGCCTVLVDGTRGVGLPLSRGVRRRRRGHHHRSTWPRRASSTGAGGVHRMRRVPMRLLHARLRADGEGNCSSEHPDPDDDQIRHYLSGNLCRCAAYPEIVNAVKMAARKNKAG